MSRRELSALGVQQVGTQAAGNNNQGDGVQQAGNHAAGNQGTGNQVPRKVEVFSVNPHANNINPSSETGSKLYLKATEALHEDEKHDLSIENGQKIRSKLEESRSRFAWGSLISKVPGDNGNIKDVIRNQKKRHH